MAGARRAARATMSPLRIVHVVTRSHRRGAEVVARELADALDARGHDDRVYALGLAFDGGIEPGLPPLTLQRRTGALMVARSSLRLRRELQRSPTDVVVAHGGWAAEAVSLATLRVNVPTVWNRILDLPERSLRGWRWNLWRQIGRQFDAAVVLSEQLAREMSTLDFDGPVWRIPNSRDPSRFRNVDRAAVRRRLRHGLGAAPDEPIIAFVGHLVPQKQPLLAVETLAAVRSAGLPARLVIAGDGPLRSALKARITALGLEPWVTLLGHRSDPEWVYFGADVTIITSAAEGVPGVAIEAHMAGCPVVTFPVGAVDDVVESGITGIVLARPDVAEMAEALTSLLKDEPLRKAMGAAAKARSAGFSADQTAAQYEVHLGSLIRND